MRTLADGSKCSANAHDRRKILSRCIRKRYGLYQQCGSSLWLPVLDLRGLSLGSAQWLKCMAKVLSKQ